MYCPTRTTSHLAEPGTQQATVMSVWKTDRPLTCGVVYHFLGNRKSIGGSGLGKELDAQRSKSGIPYQSITVADGHSCPGHSSDTSSVHTLLLQGLSEEFLKVLLPFHRGSWGHQPPVWLQPQVKQLPKDSHIKVEEMVPQTARPRGLSFQAQGTASHSGVAL